MSDYESLAVLRRALTADDPDRRANAYGDVMEHDVAVSELLADEPEESTVETLRVAGVLPEKSQSGLPTPEYRKQVLELLQEIAANTGAN